MAVTPADPILERAATHDADDARERVRGGWNLTLRAKGILAFVALVLYVFVVGLLAAQERHKLRLTVEELDRIHVLEGRLANVNTSVAHTILRLQEVYYAREPLGAVGNMVLDVEALQAGLQRLRPAFAGAEDASALLERGLEALRAAPSRGALAEMRGALHELVERLDAFTRSVNERKDRLTEGYRRHYDAITLITLIGALLGVVVFGALVTLFFSRLAADLRRLEARALDVVTGYRGAPLEVPRQDEIGSLMQSVNHMQSALRQHENQLEISRQQRFHQDKMAAVGTLAAAVTHEINNPIAAIHGLAKRMHEVRRGGCCGAAGPACQPELILEQTQRIAQITRHMSDLTSPRSAEPALVDLNALVASTASFIAFDRRFQRVRLSQALDRGIPATVACADHVTQVLMNLLINAADATEALAERAPEVEVATRALADAIEVSVRDNGCGMDRATRARAFEENFTTKPAGRGSGLGLFICKSLVERGGGRIGLESEPGRGTCVRFTVPLAAAA